MDINVRRKETPSYGIQAAGSSSGKSAGNFQQELGKQRKEDYRRRVADLFDEITNEAASMIDNADLLKFEKYRGLIGELLSEVVKNAYILHSERVMDGSGNQRIYAVIKIIDKKLEDMAKELLSRNSERISYLSSVDEIRGLIMDLLL